MSDLREVRRAYSRELSDAAGLKSDALERAFATVPREVFLGPPPWLISDPMSDDRGYRETSDPSDLYRRVLVAIDPVRGLNNGEPGALAMWLDSLDLTAGERVVHVGAGVGYYTAIIAEVVGAQGEVLGVEIDSELAERARRNLNSYATVKLVCADGSSYAPGPCDAVFLSAGATHPCEIWLKSLRIAGRLLFPLTARISSLGHGAGYYLKITRRRTGFTARFVSPVGIYPGTGARDDAVEERLRIAYQRGGQDSLRSLRLEPHEPSASCWLHEQDYCLSSEELPSSAD